MCAIAISKRFFVLFLHSYYQRTKCDETTITSLSKSMRTYMCANLQWNMLCFNPKIHLETLTYLTLLKFNPTVKLSLPSFFLVISSEIHWFSYIHKSLFHVECMSCMHQYMYLLYGHELVFRSWRMPKPSLN